MKEIPLTRGLVTLVDDEDYEFLNQWKWQAAKNGSVGYAARSRKGCEAPGPYRIYMHRVITDAPPGLEVDHINHNGLDNRRCNLRVCTQAENARNMKHRPPKHPTSSGYKGVAMNKNGTGWQVYCRKQYIGTFPTEQEAARAYNQAALEHFGEFACLNEILNVPTF